MSELIIILGAGESGTGAALLAKAKGYNPFVSEQGKIKDQYKKELVQAGVAFEEGGHTEQTILSSKLIIKSPGIPETTDIIKKAKAASIEVIDEVEFAFRHIAGKVIAITGTNGKTTTTLLTYHIMKSAGFDVALVGNVGKSFAREVAGHDYDWYVLEVSSFQLDGTKTFNPFIGILLNITPDHLDRYDYKMENYVASKFRLVDNMKIENFFIYFEDDKIIAAEVDKRDILPEMIRISLKNDPSIEAHFDGKGMNFGFREKFKIAQDEIALNGPHNLINTMAAVASTYLARVPLPTIKAALKSFKNAPHRLESIAAINEVEFVNDSKATNVDSVVYALGSYNIPLVWIAGGIDKGNDYDLIKDEVRRKVKALICLGKDNEKLKKAFTGIVPVIKETQSVKELVRMALEVAQKGDVVLLSPACASFDLFRNYEDRGDQFRNEVLALKNEVEGVKI